MQSDNLWANQKKPRLYALRESNWGDSTKFWSISIDFIGLSERMNLNEFYLAPPIERKCAARKGYAMKINQ